MAYPALFDGLYDFFNRLLKPCGVYRLAVLSFEALCTASIFVGEFLNCVTANCVLLPLAFGTWFSI